MNYSLLLQEIPQERSITTSEPRRVSEGSKERIAFSKQETIRPGFGDRSSLSPSKIHEVEEEVRLKASLYLSICSVLYLFLSTDFSREMWKQVPLFIRKHELSHCSDHFYRSLPSFFCVVRWKQHHTQCHESQLSGLTDVKSSPQSKLMEKLQKLKLLLLEIELSNVVLSQHHQAFNCSISS